MNVKSWKTTLGGALLALGPVLQNGGGAPWIWWLGQACLIGGALILGTAAKDKDVTGTGDDATRPKDDSTDWKRNARGE